MSKRWGNVINPDDVISSVGADALRIYEMFMGPFGQAIAWSTDHMVGARRFLERVYGLRNIAVNHGEENQVLLHKTIKKVGEDIANFDFNTAISQLMILVNDMERRTTVSRVEYKILLTILAPFAPHLTEELWEILGHTESIHKASWPEYTQSVLDSARVTIVVQVNGKTRATFEVDSHTEESVLQSQAKELVSVQAHLAGKTLVRVVLVPNRLVNFVVT